MSSPRILVVRPDRIGDVVLSVPVLETLRRQWPEAYLAMMVRPYTGDVLIGNPWLDEIIEDDPDHTHRGTLGFARQVRTLRAGAFDTALMLLPTMRIAWMLFLAGIPRRLGVGRTIYQTLTLTKSVSRNKYIPLRHESEYCLDMAAAIGAIGTRRTPVVFLTDDERAYAREILQFNNNKGRPLVGLHPGNGHSAPNWPAERYGELARRLQDQFQARIIVTGSDREEDLADRIQAQTSEPVQSLAGRLSLRQLIAVIGELDVLVSSSTGPMHLAGALGVPTVSLFCPLPARSPQRWRPLGDRARILLPTTGECEGCDHGPLCDLPDISMDMVLTAVEEQLVSKP